VLGKPLEEDVEFVQRESYKKVLKTMRAQPAKPWASVLPKASEQCVDMMGKMLCFNPAKRITVEEALHHPLLCGLPYDETKPNSTAEFPFVTESKDVNTVLEMLVAEVYPKCAGSENAENTSVVA